MSKKKTHKKKTKAAPQEQQKKQNRLDGYIYCACTAAALFIGMANLAGGNLQTGLICVMFVILFAAKAVGSLRMK